MKYLADPAVGAWLLVSARGFQWDSGNLDHAAPHGVSKEDVEAIFSHRFHLAGRIDYAGPESRWLLLGVDDRARKLALIFTIRADLVRPITCRRMRPNEEALYEEETRD